MRFAVIYAGLALIPTESIVLVTDSHFIYRYGIEGIITLFGLSLLILEWTAKWEK